MSITTDTENTWKNIENDSPPNIEPPIERDSNIERHVIIDDTISIEATTIHNIKDPSSYIEEPKFDETIQQLNTTKTNRIEDNDEDILQKIRKIPAYLYKNINNKCLLCSSYKKL
jgi:hypothetical protein